MLIGILCTGDHNHIMITFVNFVITCQVSICSEQFSFRGSRKGLKCLADGVVGLARFVKNDLFAKNT